MSSGPFIYNFISDSNDEGDNLSSKARFNVVFILSNGIDDMGSSSSVSSTMISSCTYFFLLLLAKLTNWRRQPWSWTSNFCFSLDFIDIIIMYVLIWAILLLNSCCSSIWSTSIPLAISQALWFLHSLTKFCAFFSWVSFSKCSNFSGNDLSEFPLNIYLLNCL